MDLIPSLQLNFAGSKMVDPRIDITRASTGTYIGSDGRIKSAAINEARLNYAPAGPVYTNLLTYSEQFDNAAWSRTRTSISANAAVAPDGTTTADKLVEDSGTGAHYSYRLQGYTSGTTYTLSCFAKAGERAKVAISLPSAAFTSARYVIADLSAGSIATVGNSPDGYGITSVGNDWYRIWVTHTATSTQASSTTVLCGLGDTLLESYTGDGTSGIYIWGAQLETGSTATTYIPTTSTIASSGYKCEGLLIEESRTNLLVKSQFDAFTSTPANSVWIEALTELDTTVNAAVAPDGTTTAALLACNTSTASRSTSQRSGVATGTTHTFSVYAKPASTDYGFALLLSGDVTATNYGRIDYTLSGNGTVGTITNTGTATSTSGSVTPLANGWYRVVITTTLTSPTNITCYIYPGTRTAQTTASQTYVWGAQLEAGAYPTSYIPTTTAPLTRSADVSSMTGTNFSSWYNQSEGTFVVEGNSPYDNTTTFRVVVSANNNGASTIQTYISKSGTVARGFVIDTATQASWTSAAWSSQKTAVLAYKVNDFSFAFNGTLSTPDTSGTPPVVDTLSIGVRTNGTSAFNGTIARITYYPRRLSDAVIRRLSL